FEFSENYLREQIKNINKQNHVSNFDTDSYISDLLTTVNLLIKEKGQFKFIHRSLQEYFATIYVKNLNTEHKHTFYDSLINKLTDTNNKFVIEYFNFYSLIYEIDGNNCVKFFEIPLINRLKQLSNG